METQTHLSSNTDLIKRSSHDMFVADNNHFVTKMTDRRSKISTNFGTDLNS